MVTSQVLVPEPPRRGDVHATKLNRVERVMSEPIAPPDESSNLIETNGSGEDHEKKMRLSQNFGKFVEDHPTNLRLLPAVRLRDLETLEVMKTTGFLPLNREGLLHFYYGKPSYKMKADHKGAEKVIARAAVAFVFDIESMPPVHRLFALDTGAFHDKRYSDFLPRDVKAEDFELLPAIPSLQRLVSAFFGSNARYYEGRIKDLVRFPLLDRAAEAYSNILNSAVIRTLDDRACTAEIQFNKPIEISKARLVTIVLPGRLYEDPEVKEFVDKTLKIKPICYRFRLATSEERTEVIYEKLGEFLEESGYLDVP